MGGGDSLWLYQPFESWARHPSPFPSRHTCSALRAANEQAPGQKWPLKGEEAKFYLDYLKPSLF